MRSKKKFLYVYAISFILASCSLLQIFHEDIIFTANFPHKVHIVDEEMDCEDCHESRENPQLPKLEICFDCHELDEKQEDSQEPSKAQVMLKELQQKGQEPWRVQGVGKEVIFTHKTHIDKKLDCTACHKNIEVNSGQSPIDIPNMKDCVSCHNSHTEGILAPKLCQQCHTKIREDTPPASHKKSWKYVHGDEMFLADETAKEICTRCHGKDGCNSCHQAEKPRNHNSFWRRTGHGLEAAMDRDRCALCHKEDYCVRCHQSTKPRNHRSGWGLNSNLHCVNCHEPLSSDLSCSVCHPNTAGHAAYTIPLPNNVTHSIATDCRACHAALRHPDNGQNCRACHR